MLGDVLGVPLSGALQVVGALVSGARTVLGGWVLLVWAVGVLGGWDGAGFVGQLGGGPAASILVSCVDHQP